MSRIKSETMTNSTVFDEDREAYEVEGYILPDQNILGEPEEVYVGKDTAKHV